MQVNELLQRVVLDALDDGYTQQDVLDNVSAAFDRHEQYVADEDEDDPATATATAN
jgi:hypothetical protein